MRILISLMYYRPHYSGLTIYTERLARALAKRGHQVTILTSRFDDALLPIENQDGVTIVRPKVLLRLSKGVVMPTLPYWAWRLIRNTDVVNAHVPQPDAALIALISKMMGKPIVITYHCDLLLPKGLIHYLANQYSHLANRISVALADIVVTNTEDYAHHSPFLKQYLSKVRAIPPPISLEQVSEDDQKDFRDRYDIHPDEKIIGMAARFASEKGVEYLVGALPKVLEKIPNARVLFAGQSEGVLGEEEYAQRLAPRIASLGRHWTFLGVLPPKEWSSFFHTADVTVLPSINSTESFGMVQIESMSCGTPVVASDLPGVRQPVLTTGMGKIVPPRNADAIADALIEILSNPNGFIGEKEKIAESYSPDVIAAQYECLFDELIADIRSRVRNR